MTPELWQLFLDLQTKSAYANGLGAPNYGIIDYSIEQMKGIIAARAFQHFLLIGPGGHDEVLAFRNTVAGTMHVLTAHQPEVEHINQQGWNVEVSCGDMHTMPYESLAFDFVYNSNVLEHALSPYIALMEIRRVMVLQGLAYFVLPSFEGPEGGRGPYHLHCLTQEVWSELLRKTGFSVTNVLRQDGPQGYYMHYFCTAVTPPVPHDRMLQTLIAHKASR